MTTLDTLRRLASAYSGSMNRDLAGPHEIEAAPSERWAVATDGKGMLWTQDYLERELPSLDPKSPQAVTLLALLRLAQNGVYSPCGLPRLKHFLGDSVWEQPCPACKGTSKVSEYVYCSFCDEAGSIQGDLRRGYLLGQPIDRNRLACLLESFTDTVVGLALGKTPVGEGHGECVLVRGYHWYAILMGMTPTPEGTDDKGEWATAPRWPEGR